MLNYIASMKKQATNRQTLQTDASHQLQDAIHAPMTPDQQILFAKGLYFPESIVFSTDAAIKLNCHEWTQNVLIQLTTQALADIPLTQITKVKLIHANNPEKLILKIIAKKCYFYQVRRHNAILLFSAIIWSKLATMNLFSQLEQRFDKEIKGEVFKKSEFFKCWEKRYTILSKQKGLESFKNGKGEPAVRVTATTEVWTRFDTIESQAYLTVKLWRGIRKEELALPIETALQWIQGLCCLIN